MNRNLKLFTLIFGLMAISATGICQKEGAIWYFGHNAGLDFTQHYPRPITDGQTFTKEGIATMSTSEGDLLFYTDGVTVWNKNHQVMENGTGLYGHAFSTQSAIILPTPGKQHEYYIYTVGIVGVTGDQRIGHHYNIVDMRQNNGLGKVITKNERIPGYATEKLTAIKHDNGED
ncbi:MAG: hypothetical protein HOC82_18000, partial [Bacteroidetes bacterium]|nr:hypothetical protein [Bacteroidota bacterium]